MELKEAISRLEGDASFKAWKKDNPKAYISHGFMMFEQGKSSHWEIGFCDPKDNAITVFELKHVIHKREPEKPFRKDDSKVPPLDLEKLKSTMADAIAITDGIQKEKYNGHTPMKVIVLAQTLAEGQCWNVSYITNSFKILNVKIDTSSKEVLSERLVSIIADMQ